MKTTTHPLTEDYLRRLEHAARMLPRGQRDDLVGEIRSHLQEGLDPEATEADVRNLLDRLGSPEHIVRAAQPNATVPTRGLREVFAVVLLVVGFPPIIGWLVGLGLLLSSSLWSARQKLLGALVWPGGLFGMVMFATMLPEGGRSCSGWTGPPGSNSVTTSCSSSGLPPWAGTLVLAVMLFAQVFVAVYLYRVASRRAVS